MVEKLAWSEHTTICICLTTYYWLKLPDSLQIDEFASFFENIGNVSVFYRGSSTIEALPSERLLSSAHVSAISYDMKNEFKRIVQGS